jgi:hypothetical protein
MPSSKEQVKTNRLSVAYAIGFGTIMYIFGRFLLSEGHNDLPTKHPRIFFVGDANFLPHFFVHFLPLDWVACCAYVGLMAYLISKGPTDTETGNSKQFAMQILGYLALIGTLGGIIGAMMFGWFTSMEMFLAMDVAALLICAGLAGFCGIFYLLYRLLDPIVKYGWNWFTWLPAARPLLRMIAYFNADDVPDEPKHS